MPHQTRRTFLSRGSAAVLINATHCQTYCTEPLRAVAFDGFAVFDPTPLSSFIKKQAPEKGVELVKLWRTRQFEYTWLRSLTSRYVDFRQISLDSLMFAERALGVELGDASHRQILDLYLQLPAWPDVAESLQALKDLGLRLTLLSNMTLHMLESCTQNAKLKGVFDATLSVDLVKIYKPAPQAYEIGTQILRLKKEEILFVASAGWDAGGAKAFGYPTYWVNRQSQPPEWMDAAADGVGPTLFDLVTWVKKRC